MAYIYLYNAITGKLDLVNAVITAYYLLLEDDGKLLKEDDGLLLLEG
jgi:hypothetical protein